MTTRTLVVTGGHGILGKAVVEAALAKGLNVALIDHAKVRRRPRARWRSAGST